MAAKKKRRKKKVAEWGTRFDTCGDLGCRITRARPVRTSMYEGFDYTTPNAVNEGGPIRPLSKRQRAQAGCATAVVDYVGKGGVIKTKTINTDERPECVVAQKPCASSRKSCPVQLFYRQGQPYLRFCRRKGAAGFVKPVHSAAQAQELAARACHCWATRGRRQFDARCAEITGTELGATRRRRLK